MGRKAFAALVMALPVVASAGLSVEERGGRLCVMRNGEVLVSEVSVDRGGIDDGDVKHSSAVLSDGTRVWNRWSEVEDRRFRLEVAERSDGAVEITMMGQMGPESITAFTSFPAYLLSMNLSSDPGSSNSDIDTVLSSSLCIFAVLSQPRRGSSGSGRSTGIGGSRGAAAHSLPGTGMFSVSSETANFTGRA